MTQAQIPLDGERHDGETTSMSTTVAADYPESAGKVAHLLLGFFESTEAIRSLPRMMLLRRLEEVQGTSVAQAKSEDDVRQQLIRELCFGQQLRSSSRSPLFITSDALTQQAEAIVNGGVTIIEDAEGFRVRPTTSEANRWLRQANLARRTFQEMAKVHERSLLISTTTIAEVSIARLLNLHFQDHPRALDDATISIRELSQFDTPKEAIGHAIEQKIEGMLQKSAVEWLQQTLKTLDIELIEPCTVLLPEFEEAFLRRNLMVHSDGFVGRQYLDKCGKYARANGIERGQRLDVDYDYITDRIDVVVSILSYIFYAYLLRMEKRCLQPRRQQIVIDHCIRLIELERFRLANHLCDIIIEDDLSPERARLVARVNKCQITKWLGDEEGCYKQVHRIDWSAADMDFRLARHVLLDEYDLAGRLAEDCVGAGKISVDALLSWPLFKRCRDRGTFDELLKNAEPEIE